MIFGTEKLRARKLSVNGLDVFHRIHSDKELMGSISAPALSLDECQTELKSIVNAYAIPDQRLRVWGVFLGLSGHRLTNEYHCGCCANVALFGMSD